MKRAFTLVEVLVSVALLAIIVMFLVDSSFNLKKGYENLYKKEVKRFSDYDIKEVIYKDILESSQLNIDSNRKFDVLSLKTKNSLYERESSFVVYTVLQKGNVLIRLESDNNLSLPVDQKDIYSTNFLVLKKDLEEFKIYKNENGEIKDLLMLYFKEKNQNPILFEIGLINDY